MKGLAMNVLIIVVTVLCFGYLVYAMIRPERF
ncbi:MAG: K(+)-transporting ATPase subunit F [Phycisphaeraceae bacterium]